MKKTENMNIGGFAFTVEEDAAEALAKYMGAVREQYAADPSVDEICSDIEERVGELLLEKCGASRIVSTWMVDYAKSVMGEFETEESRESPTEEKVETSGQKRLYRDIDNKFLAGVFSGLAAYTDMDVVIYRVAYSVLCLAALFIDKSWSETVFGMLLLSYVVMWVCVPAARTVEQKCLMSGKPISVNDFGRTPAVSATERKSEIRNTPALHYAGRVIMIVIGALMFLTGSFSVIACGAMNMLPGLISGIADDIDFAGGLDGLFSTGFMTSLLVSVLLISAWNIYSGILLIFNLESPKWRPGLILLVLFLLSTVVCGYFLARGCGGFMQF